MNDNNASNRNQKKDAIEIQEPESITPTFQNGDGKIDEQIVQTITAYFRKLQFKSGFEDNPTIWAMSAIANEAKHKYEDKFKKSLKQYVENLQKHMKSSNLWIIPIEHHPFQSLNSFADFLQKCGVGAIDIQWLDSYQYAVQRLNGKIMSDLVDTIKRTLTVKSVCTNSINEKQISL